MGADHATRFARVDFRGDDRVFDIKDEDRFSHVNIIGKTGTGKSTSSKIWRSKTWSAATALR